MIHIFIINPFAGSHNFSSDLREQLSGYEDLQYFVFNTRYEGHETELVRKLIRLFNNEKLRFYCCGGSGTLRNMLNGIDNLENVEIAFYPCGLSNNFLKVFGNDEKRFSNIDELINGEVADIDYIWTDHGIALNSVSVGHDCKCLSGKEKLRHLSFIHRNFPYFLAIILSFFTLKVRRFKVTVDDEEPFIGRTSEIFFGNGFVIGGFIHFADGASVSDGQGIVRISLVKKRGIQLMRLNANLLNKNFSKAYKLMTFMHGKTMKIRRTSRKTFTINQDGEIIRNVPSLKMRIVRQGLHFVVPKGVRP